MIIVNFFAFTCLATMLTSKLITEIMETHSDFHVRASSFNKFFQVDRDKSWNYL